MADYTDILIGNLKETFKAIEKFLLVGFTASLVLIVLAITDRELLGTQKVMIADLNAPAVLVAFVALGTYIASGVFAALYFVTRRRIVKKLDNGELLDAVLTYPSIVARVGTLQVLALLFVGGTGIVAVLLFFSPTRGIQTALVTGLIIGSPYLVLVAMAFITAVQERRH
ncbi:MAG TPA: hypothetical protein VL866_16035 [Pyrinomonadaceae bacterium]|nr:hypothetical protein [Pyrinomonadaceae bacterium]